MNLDALFQPNEAIWDGLTLAPSAEEKQLPDCLVALLENSLSAQAHILCRQIDDNKLRPNTDLWPFSQFPSFSPSWENLLQQFSLQVELLTESAFAVGNESR